MYSSTVPSSHGPRQGRTDFPIAEYVDERVRSRSPIRRARSSKLLTRWGFRVRRRVALGVSPQAQLVRADDIVPATTLPSTQAHRRVALKSSRFERVREIESPVGYLYRVGRTLAFRSQARDVPVAELAPGVASRDDSFEPGLAPAIARLSEAQRCAVVLVVGFGYTLREAAEVLGVTASTVHRDSERRSLACGIRSVASDRPARVERFTRSESRALERDVTKTLQETNSPLRRSADAVAAQRPPRSRKMPDPHGELVPQPTHGRVVLCDLFPDVRQPQCDEVPVIARVVRTR